ncbi:MAG: hypothetical protein ACLFVK_08330 [Dehalococcoidia bacterium]
MKKVAILGVILVFSLALAPAAMADANADAGKDPVKIVNDGESISLDGGSLETETELDIPDDCRIIIVLGDEGMTIYRRLLSEGNLPLESGGWMKIMNSDVGWITSEESILGRQVGRKTISDVPGHKDFIK